MAHEDAEYYRKQYEQSYHLAQMKIFQIKNSNMGLKDTYLDLHGLQRVEAINII